MLDVVDRLDTWPAAMFRIECNTQWGKTVSFMDQQDAFLTRSLVRILQRTSIADKSWTQCRSCPRDAALDLSPNSIWGSAMKIETAWYECGPYIYGAAGITAILYPPGSILLKASGFLLFFAALTILGLRWLYRRDFLHNSKNAIDQRKYIALITQDMFIGADNRRSEGKPAARRAHSIR